MIEILQVRDSEEIQKAHDALSAIIAGEVPDPFEGGERETCVAALDVLCWILRHDHNPAFAENLAKVDAFLKERGFALIDTGTLERDVKIQ